MFFGFFKLAVDSVVGYEQARNDTDNPAAAAAAPVYRVYGPDGVQIGVAGTCTTHDTTNLVGCYRFSFSTTSPEYSRGTMYAVVVTYTVSSSTRQSTHYFMVT